MDTTNNNNRSNVSTTNQGGYTATRTSANTGNNLFGNVTNSVWTWLIVAIVGIVIVGLVMYYAKQNNNVITYNNDDDDDDNQ